MNTFGEEDRQDVLRNIQAAQDAILRAKACIAGTGMALSTYAVLDAVKVMLAVAKQELKAGR